MRIVIIILLLIAFLYYVIVYPLKNKGGKNWFMVVILLLAIIPLSIFEARWLILQNKGSEVTAIISGNDEGYLHCQRLAETFFDAKQNLGEVKSSNPNESYIKYTTCIKLFDYIQSDKTNPPLEQVIAVHVLSHEAGHVGGDYNEASTECIAMQNDSWTAQMLGATPTQGDALAQQYYKNVYPKMRAGYTSEQCSQNGEMDLTPEDNIFP